MKYQALFSILFAILLAGVHSEDNWSDAEETCVSELKLEKTEITKLNNEDIAPEDNTNYNNFLACSWKKEGILNADGTINWKKLDDFLEEEFKKEFGDEPDTVAFLTGLVVGAAIGDCQEKNIKGSTDGQTIVKVQNCIKKNILEAIASAEKNN